MFGWITGAESAAVMGKVVPYWQSAHSLMRTVTVSGASIVQLPAVGTFEPLRSEKPMKAGPIRIEPPNGTAAKTGAAGYLPHITGDALEILATFSTDPADGNASSFGLSLRVDKAGKSTCTTGAEKGLFAMSLYTKTRTFSKTGSGQTWENFEQKTFLHDRLRRASESDCSNWLGRRYRAAAGRWEGFPPRVPRPLCGGDIHRRRGRHDTLLPPAQDQRLGCAGYRPLGQRRYLLRSRLVRNG